VLTERAEALVISEEAIVGEQRGFFVWRVREGKVEKVPVQLGTRMETEVEILSGLAEGDQVVIAGQLKIRRPGQPAKVLPAPPVKGAQPAAKGPPPAAKASPPTTP
jgi:membrane fusion protein (multidrug efflux system)